MTEETSNVIRFADHRTEPSNVSQHSKRAAAEHKRWLEIWRDAWVDEGARRGKSLPANERRALASHIQRMAAEIKIMHGFRSGKIAAVLAGAIQMTKDEVQARGCPQKVIAAATAVREYRLDRFANPDPKLLRGKLLDWLRVTELLAGLLDRDPKREIILLYDESRIDFARRERSSLSDSYDAIFVRLAGQLQQIAADAARSCDFATYYECCDKMHAAWFDGDIIEDDGWLLRFKRNEFEQQGWVPADGGPDWDDPAARSPLGLVGEILLHTPLARVTLARVKVTDSMREGGIVGDLISVDLDVHLALRPDVEDPREAGALLLHPMITTFDADLVQPPEKAPVRWWRAIQEVSLEGVSIEARQEIFAAATIGNDQHMERALTMARNHLEEIKLLPLSSAACQAWLSFGSNSLAQEFVEFFWHDPSVTPNPTDVVSAPAGTLAGYMQFNLVMAGANGHSVDRIDQRLAADAARKTGVLEKLLARKKATYDAQIKKSGFPNAQESGSL